MILIPLEVAGAIAFWLLAPVMIGFAIGMVMSRKAVHSALSLAGLMMSLAVLYASLDAPFLFVAQIIVYTGSVLMLFIFTMMLIGVDTTEDIIQVVKGQRIAAIVAGVALIALLLLAVGQGVLTEPVGLETANARSGGNVGGIAELVFGRYVLAFEAASALITTGAVAAMVLAHADRLTPQENQRARSERKLREYAATGAHPGPRPSSGVFARHNSIDYPALLPDGSVAPSSISPTLQSRGMAIVEEGDLRQPVVSAYKEMVDTQADLVGAPMDVPAAQPPTSSSSKTITATGQSAAQAGERR